MRKIDKDGLLLCELQAGTFEISIDMTLTSSEIFIRRFMNSRIAKSLDSSAILQTNLQSKDILDRVEEQYGTSEYGTLKYTPDEMYWIGYLYRYFSYTYDLSSVQVYKIVKPKELRDLFLPYHTMDPSQAVERILEAKGILHDNEAELRRQYEIFRRIRNNK
ncbi:antitoxin [Faecalicatena contorta]|uniref:antitoxin n=1 Tax=Faecalicatena contorta TaxID=39482 RepID=UPI001F1D7C49|nr:antitoxin [Faecalicatena contorta]MCF2553985.1 antitoxin [Faecalicatena contorta]